MKNRCLRVFAIVWCLCAGLLAQDSSAGSSGGAMALFASNSSVPLGPEMALERYGERIHAQNEKMPSYENQTVIHAELPDSAQKADYELIASYTAQPRSLSYTSVRFEGDRFVKGNVIVRLLQSDVDRVRKGEDSSTAINHQNYKFSYKGIEEIRGRQVHVFSLKPRHKVAGLFKGKIFLATVTGSMLRMEGTMVKSPSFFVHDINFVQDFEDLDGFMLPTELRSTARARIIGRTLVSIVHRAYKFHASDEPREERTSADGFPGNE